MPTSGRPLLLGHRGTRAIKSIPENSFAAFDRALADGCDGFEFDVRVTSDGVAVVCHDPRFEGTEIARASAQQCAKLPGLEQVLDRYAERGFLDIELKVEGTEKITLGLLQKYPPLRGFVVSSFLPQVLQSLRAEAPTMPLGLICEEKNQSALWNQLSVEYVIPHRKLAKPDQIREWKNAKKKILVWTINSPADMRKFRELGVDGIISDDASLLVRTVGA